MSRPVLACLAVGLLGAGAVMLLALFGAPVMPSVLGAWLVVLGLPLGALPVVMGGELLDLPETRLVATLRRLVAVMPLSALLSIPVLLRLDGLYPWLAAAKGGLAGWWMTPGFFVARAVVFLAAWTALSLLFARPGRRPRAAGFGLGLHLAMGTLAAVDWAQAVEPGFNSSAFGLSFIVAQCSLAVSLAVVMAIVGRSPSEAARALSADRRDLAATRRTAVALAVLLGFWGFLAFTQYLVAWSANLPREVVWYQHRSAGLGFAAEASAGILCVLALLALLPRGLSHRAGLLAWVAAALLVMHALEMLWLVTPAFRLAFRVIPADLAALAGAAGLGIGTALLAGDRFETGRGRHGAA